MLHIHFETGRLGLGLVAPFFQNQGSELYLLNRASSAKKATGSTALDPARRNELLQNHSKKTYLIETSGAPDGRQQRHAGSARQAGSGRVYLCGGLDED